MAILVAYILFLLVALHLDNRKRRKTTTFLVGATCVVLSLIAGFRDVRRWADTDSYMICFDRTSSLFDFRIGEEPYGYTEYGYYLLSVLIKTFSSSYVVYFLLIAAISLFFIYKDLRRYSSLPLLGMAVYIARFFAGRNLIQIRSGLAYAIMLLGVRYITTRDWKKYFLIVAIAYSFHHSAIIAAPLYFVTYIKINKAHVVIGMIIAFILGGFFQGPMQTFVTEQVQDISASTAATYTRGYEVEGAKGLANPLIYFQTILLMFYTFNENKLKKVDAHYYTIRAAYLYSTMILTTFCMFVALSSRTATLFATLEIAIIPSLLNVFHKRNRVLGYIAVFIGLLGVFYLNYF